ncbi:unnamed protein product [Amoebophrya sp. A25]|nr:unnamed protein product [Amoebophrya sp. A25]|eukprot:GSA25T00017267001.1
MLLLGDDDDLDVTATPRHPAIPSSCTLHFFRKKMKFYLTKRVVCGFTLLIWAFSELDLVDGRRKYNFRGSAKKGQEEETPGGSSSSCGGGDKKQGAVDAKTSTKKKSTSTKKKSKKKPTRTKKKKSWFSSKGNDDHDDETDAEPSDEDGDKSTKKKGVISRVASSTWNGVKYVASSPVRGIRYLGGKLSGTNKKGKRKGKKRTADSDEESD